MPFTLYILALAVFVMGTSEFMLAGLLPSIAVELDVGVGTAGLLTSAYALGMVIGAPTMAAFARRWPPRLTLIACLLVFAGSHVVGAMTSVFSLLVITRVLSAIANAGFLAVALNAATALVPANLKGRALSILLSGTTLATIAGVPAGSLLGTALGWRATFWAIAGLCCVATVGVVRGSAGGVGRSARIAAPSRLRGELGQLATPRLAVTMMLGALINGGTFAAFTFLAPVVTDSAGLAEAWVSFVLMVFGLGSFLGVTAAGRLSDRWPGRVLVIGGPLLLAGWIVLAISASHPVALIVLVFLQGAISFGVGSTLITRVMYAASGAPTMGGSYATASLNVGAAGGPVLGAIGLSAGLGLLAPVWAASTLTAIALVIMLLFRRVIVPRGIREGDDEA